ncbi:YihY/virulence factor BrkB family protein [Paracoccus sp. 1_MG-2023]|uniref:YihY/virulence factor BrkB family protein n=1 Tax=unclassified Paracoccus (in: a-proteobacteria) TaxID=2688777 RepID=UPI001C0A2B77|nr:MULTISPECIES: YihY/virulence factor BrkB family protein [unclassified Paracoccus (in: a-proteobacteria)]MBU2957236.1 YihY/virulence factor BrkB family protein [Paracoccus sp. C2R09]MDO6669123.1 YihY/virulence factor BrkB family protein [Paracoccus sp. 1_MG-2023]
MLERLRDFGTFLGAILERMDKTHMTLIAAGVAFYSMFAVFPGLAAIIALWSLWFDPDVVLTYLEVAHEFLPSGAATLVDDQVMSLTANGRTSVGWTSFLSFMIATIAARAGVDALIRGLNAAYGVRAHPTIFGFVLAYALTLVIVGISLAGLATIVIVPVVLNFFVFAPFRSMLLTYLPWAGMFLLVILTIGILYRYGPNVKTPRTPIFTWGALFAALLWSAGSMAFSSYLGSFNSYNRIYGSIGTVVALLMWFYVAGFSVLLGALINVELARRRRLRAVRAAKEEFMELAKDDAAG